MMSVLLRWLSQVCEVITDPSVDAFRPTMIDVQARDVAGRKRTQDRGQRGKTAHGSWHHGFPLAAWVIHAA